MNASRTIVWVTAWVMCWGLATNPGRAAPPSTEPVEGLHENTPAVHALCGARIVAAPGRVIEGGTLVVRDGVIEAVGADVPVPPDARVWPLEGKTIYAGLIDAYGPTSIDAVSATQGAPHWNPQVQPHREAARAYRLDRSLAATLRSQGIVCRLVVPDSGVIQGTSALVTTGDASGKSALVAPRVALHLRLTVDPNRRDKKGYPKSPMGAIALARQAFYDADWYARAWSAYGTDPGLPRPERNDALERLAEYVDGSKLVIVEAHDEQAVLRADRFAREFALKIAVRGSGREYARLEAVRATGRPLIVPVAFPEPPNVATPEAAMEVSLRELMHWDTAPENPARLAAAGVPIAFCTDRLKSPKKFLAGVRKAVARGLDEEVALAALTTEPARWFGVDDRLGTLEAGKAAHLVVTDGDLVAEKTRVLATWVDGRRYEVEAAPLVDLRGTWRVTRTRHRRRRLLLTLRGKPGKLEGTIRPEKQGSESTKLSLVGRRDARFGCTFDGKPWGTPGAVQLSTVVSTDEAGGMTWLGTLHWPDGTREPIRVAPVEPKAAEKPDEKGEGDEDSPTEEEEEKPPPVDAAASFPVNYPLGAFGLAGLPEQPARVAFTGATVWTCDEPGVVEGATVLIGEGKIVAVGDDVEVPGDAVVVDCKGKHVTPGIIDCHSHMANDSGTNEGSQAVSAEVRIGDFLDDAQPSIYRQLAGGVTASHVLHGSANPIGGQNQLIKLRWGALPEELKFTEAPPTIKFALGENVKQSNWGDDYTTRYPQTRMGVAEIIRDALEAARAYAARWETWRATRRGLPPRRDLELDALVEVLSGERWVHCHAYRQDEILALMETLDEFGVRVAALQHVLEGYKVADAMARHRAGGSAFSDWWAYKFEVYDAIPYNGALMHRAGVLVSFNSDSRELARHLNHEAAKAVKYGGLSPEEALNFVTRNPAEQLMVERYVGSLAPGKHADLVVWSGPPLSNYSRPEQTWVDGRKYFDLDEHRLARRQARKRRAALVQKVLAAEELTDKSDKTKDDRE